MKKSGCVITLLNHQIEKDVQVSLGKEFSDTSKIMESATVKKLKKAGKVISPPMPEKTPNRFGELNALVALNDPLEMVFHNMDSEDSEERVAESLSYAVEKLNKIFINFTEQLSEVNRLFQAHESLRGKVQTLLKDVPPNNNTLDVRLP